MNTKNKNFSYSKQTKQENHNDYFSDKVLKELVIEFQKIKQKEENSNNLIDFD